MVNYIIALNSTLGADGRVKRVILRCNLTPACLLINNEIKRGQPCILKRQRWLPADMVLWFLWLCSSCRRPGFKALLSLFVPLTFKKNYTLTKYIFQLGRGGFGKCNRNWNKAFGLTLSLEDKVVLASVGKSSNKHPSAPRVLLPKNTSSFYTNCSAWQGNIIICIVENITA